MAHDQVMGHLDRVHCRVSLIQTWILLECPRSCRLTACTSQLQVSLSLCSCLQQTQPAGCLFCGACSKYWQSDAAVAPGHGPIRCPEGFAGQSMAQVACHQEEGELDTGLVAASAWLTDQPARNLQVVLSETVQDALFVMEPLSQHELLQMGRGRYR